MRWNINISMISESRKEKFDEEMIMIMIMMIIMLEDEEGYYENKSKLS